MSTITWVTAKGDLGTIPESQFFSLQFEATEISDNEEEFKIYDKKEPKIEELMKLMDKELILKENKNNKNEKNKKQIQSIRNKDIDLNLVENLLESHLNDVNQTKLGPAKN